MTGNRRQPRIVVPKEYRNRTLRDVPKTILAQSVDLGHLGLDTTMLRVGHMALFNLPKSDEPIPAVITRILPPGHLVDSWDDYDEETGDPKKVPWGGRLPMINLKAFRPFVPNPGEKAPDAGFPTIDELVAGPVPHLWDVQQQAKAAGYPEVMARQVMSYLIVRKIDAQ